MNFFYKILGCLPVYSPLILVVALFASIVSPAHATTKEKEEQVLAVVGDTVITMRDYHIALRDEARRRFYHGKPAEAQVAEFRREIADKLVDEALVINEAKRRGLKADEQAIEQQINTYKARARSRNGKIDDNNPLWQALHEQLVRKNLVEQLKQSVLSDRQVSSDEVKKYYQEHPDKFTEPQQMKVSVILLKVPPSSPSTAWEAARDEARSLIERINAGESFEELAKLHSSDPSAKNGGNMGYLHHGMLSPSVQQELDKMQVGTLSGPVTVLEGIVIVRLAERVPARLNEFADVQERAKLLYYRELGQNEWDKLLTKLRTNTSIKRSDHYPKTNKAEQRINYSPFPGHKLSMIRDVLVADIFDSQYGDGYAQGAPDSILLSSSVASVTASAHHEPGAGTDFRLC